MAKFCSYLRLVGSFAYALFCSGVFCAIGWRGLSYIASEVSGFWMSAVCFVVAIPVLGWMTEYGMMLLSIPFNWLWDRTLKTRAATSAGAIIGGIVCLAVPFLLPVDFSAGDWGFATLWMAMSFVWAFNLFLMPFTNFNMGVGSSNCNAEEN